MINFKEIKIIFSLTFHQIHVDLVHLKKMNFHTQNKWFWKSFKLHWTHLGDQAVPIEEIEREKNLFNLFFFPLNKKWNKKKIVKLLFFTNLTRSPCGVEKVAKEKWEKWEIKKSVKVTKAIIVSSRAYLGAI